MLVGQDPGNAATLLRIALDAGDSTRVKLVVRAADDLDIIARQLNSSSASVSN
ncbi:hypothetical protein SAMN05443668_110295 [Cryptosporangium aurantiacum]|uniref:Uncharacterized protein n=1 Tax=Cryptosporangium aurantiacum TaxID=134849 RepID=A0A1M7RER7_9ACTN|nr:hypothetical protein SAMN05443668_110295 [Cryptosporangium aurantiacum]